MNRDRTYIDERVIGDVNASVVFDGDAYYLEIEDDFNTVVFTMSNAKKLADFIEHNKRVLEEQYQHDLPLTPSQSNISVKLN